MTLPGQANCLLIWLEKLMRAESSKWKDLFNNCLGSHRRTISYDTGHFAFETHAVEIGQEILAFLKGHL